MHPQCRCAIPEIDEDAMNFAEYFDVALPPREARSNDEILYHLRYQRRLALDAGIVPVMPEDPQRVASAHL
jgi:hypothetical protein